MKTNQEIFNRENNGSICKFKSCKEFAKEVRSLFNIDGFSTPKKNSRILKFNEFSFGRSIEIGDKFLIDLEDNKIYKILDSEEIYRVKHYEMEEVSSLYAQTEAGVYRLSFHWGNVGKSKWTLDDPDYILGYANWDAFKFND